MRNKSNEVAAPSEHPVDTVICRNGAGVDFGAHSVCGSLFANNSVCTRGQDRSRSGLFDKRVIECNFIRESSTFRQASWLAISQSTLFVFDQGRGRPSAADSSASPKNALVSLRG
jgi:hypothetical protein